MTKLQKRLESRMAAYNARQAAKQNEQVEQVCITNVHGKDFTVQQYKDFVYNPDNIGNCAQCPDNQGFREGSSRIAGPCGQQNCWVAVHCA